MRSNRPFRKGIGYAGIVFCILLSTWVFLGEIEQPVPINTQHFTNSPTKSDLTQPVFEQSPILQHDEPMRPLYVALPSTRAPDQRDDECSGARMGLALELARKIHATPTANHEFMDYVEAMRAFNRALSCDNPSNPESLRDASAFASLWDYLAQNAKLKQMEFESNPQVYTDAYEDGMRSCQKKNAELSQSSITLSTSLADCAKIYAISHASSPFDAAEPATAVAARQIKLWHREWAWLADEPENIKRTKLWLDTLGYQTIHLRANTRLWSLALLPENFPSGVFD